MEIKNNYKGFLSETITDGLFTGWAINNDNPSERVEIDIILNKNQFIQTITADIFQDNLLKFGDGNYGFSFKLQPEYFTNDQPLLLNAVIKATGKPLKGSPVFYCAQHNNSIPDFAEPAKAIIGNDGWLFLINDSNKELDHHSDRIKTPETKTLEHINILEKRIEYFQSINTPYFFIICPNKSTVYNDYLPEIHRRKVTSATDQLFNPITKALPKLNFLNLEKTLIDKQKQNIEVFYRTDTHWNEIGAYYAYVEIINSVKKIIPQISEPHSLEQFIQKIKLFIGDLGRKEKFVFYNDNLVAVKNWSLPPSYNHENAVRLVYNGTNKAKKVPLPKELDIKVKTYTNELFVNEDKSLPKAVIFHDSFAVWLKPFLAEHFSETYFYWMPHPDKEIIEQIKPDVVFSIKVERFIVGPNQKLDAFFKRKPL